jgi:hypothetical protein
MLLRIADRFLPDAESGSQRGRSASGHEDQFRPPSLSGGCRLGKATFAGMGGKEKDAPIPAVRRSPSCRWRLTGRGLDSPAAKSFGQSNDLIVSNFRSFGYATRIATLAPRFFGCTAKMLKPSHCCAVRLRVGLPVRISLPALSSAATVVKPIQIWVIVRRSLRT